MPKRDYAEMAGKMQDSTAAFEFSGVVMIRFPPRWGPRLKKLGGVRGSGLDRGRAAVA